MPRLNLIPELVSQHSLLRQIRRDIHAHPELGFDEWRTADVISHYLKSWGITVEQHLAKTGIVGIIKAGQSDRAIGLRADMDALPIQELNRFAHTSTHPGRMHACGHDGHCAMLLGAAWYLSQHHPFDGTVYLIFQPAEEHGGGARVMIEEGLFERFPMQSVFGLHNWPGLEAGQFAISSGPVMASSNTFSLTIRGKGCHAALPHLGLDPIPVAAQIILALQTLLTRNANPTSAGLISVTQINGGEAVNVIADQCTLAGTVRTFEPELLDLIERRMHELCKHICNANGMQGELEFNRNYPATVNHPEAVEIAQRAMQQVSDSVVIQQPTMGAEDFAFMLQQRPGCYGFIGNGDGHHRLTGHGDGPCTLHNASYDFNDELLTIGASYWVRLAELCLPRQEDQ